jgi:hypothetical protein
LSSSLEYVVWVDVLREGVSSTAAAVTLEIFKVVTVVVPEKRGR